MQLTRVRLGWLFCAKRAFTSCNSAHLEPVSLLRSTTQKQQRHVLCSLRQTLAYGMPSPGSCSPRESGGFFFLNNDEKPTSQLIPATKRKTYLFSKIPNYERRNLAGRCALLSSSWLLFAWVYLPADIHDVTEIHFTTVTTSRPNPVTE